MALRELVRPFDGSLPDAVKVSLWDLSLKIYAALIELERKDAINMEMDENECLLLNQRIGNEDWSGALSLLRQTWAVLWEWKHNMPPGRGEELDAILAIAEQEETGDEAVKPKR
jgi:hypothetical protein